MCVIKKRLVDLCIYISMIILCVLGMARIDAWAATGEFYGYDLGYAWYASDISGRTSSGVTYSDFVPKLMTEQEFADILYSDLHNLDKTYTLSVPDMNGRQNAGTIIYNTKTKVEKLIYNYESGGTLVVSEWGEGSNLYNSLAWWVGLEDIAISLRYYLTHISSTDGYWTQGGEYVNKNLAQGYREKITLYAYPLGFNITFNVNGGSTTISSQTVSTISLPSPGSRTGYTFAGWYNGNTKIGDVGTSWTPTADATITAKWTPVTYSISYVLNGGTNNSGNPSSYNIETATITLKDPTRTGYTFAGWHSDSGLTSRVTTINKGSTGNKTFYAKWTPRTDTKYVVKHQLMNVSGSGYTLKDTENLKGTTDINVTPARKSYTGFTAPAAQTATINADGSRVFTYSYSRNKYTATFNGNGGTASKTSASLYYEATLGTLPTATRTGYNFKGWYTAASGGTQITSSTKIMGNTTYYAQWTPITYTITYKLNGGKVDYKKVKYNIETPTFYIENPTKKGYNFTGWTGTGISTVTTDLSVPVGSYGNKTFEATWGNGVYAISFDGNGATSGSMETINVKAGESVKLPENGFVRDGYSFVGWYTTKEDRFGTFYKNGAEVSDLAESITLHAQWRLDRGTHVHDGSDDPEGNGDNGNGGNAGSGTGNGASTGGNGSGNSEGGPTGGNTGDNGNGSGNGDGTSAGGNTSGAGGNGSGSAGDNNDNGSGNNGDRTSTGDGGNGKDVTGRGDDDKHNTPVITPKDEIGYFGTGKKRNEISLLTSLGMNDKKLTLNYNY